MATRDGSGEWRGDLSSGSGTVSVASGLFTDGNFSFSSRFEEGPGTNPEELIAAAHAGCFSMALSNILAGDGHTPESVQTTAIAGGVAGTTGMTTEVFGYARARHWAQRCGPF